MAADGRTPAALRSRPQPTLAAQPYLAAFRELTSSRTMTTDGIGPIPMTEIEAYARMTGVTTISDRRELIYYVHACDAAYLEAIKKRRPARGARKRPADRGR